MMRWNILQHGLNKTIFHRMDWWRCMMILPMVSPWEEQPNFHGIPETIVEAILSGQEPDKSYGLYNVHTRLKKIYGSSGGLSIQHTDGETRISFLIPFSSAAHRSGDWEAAE